MRKIWFSRHGESEYNMYAKIGGDSNISPQGQIYAKMLPDLLVDRVPLVSITCTSARCSQACHHTIRSSVAHIPHVYGRLYVPCLVHNRCQIKLGLMLLCRLHQVLQTRPAPTICADHWSFARVLLMNAGVVCVQTSDGQTMPVSVWTSTLRRTIQTAEHLPFPKLRWKVQALRLLCACMCIPLQCKLCTCLCSCVCPCNTSSTPAGVDCVCIAAAALRLSRNPDPPDAMNSYAAALKRHRQHHTATARLQQALLCVAHEVCDKALHPWFLLLRTPRRSSSKYNRTCSR